MTVGDDDDAPLTRPVIVDDGDNTVQDDVDDDNGNSQVS